jgi:hypothetical protein
MVGLRSGAPLPGPPRATSSPWLRNRDRLRVLQQGVPQHPPSPHNPLPSHRRRSYLLPPPALGLLCAVCALVCAAAGALAARAGATPSLSWSSPLEIDGGQALSGISCASRSLCVAGDGEGRVLVSTNPATGTSATWRAVDIDKGHALSAVSCPTLGLCVAVDDAGHVLVSTSPAIDSPGAWFALAIDGTTALSSVSCASGALCVAVDGEGRAFVSTNPASATPSAWHELRIDGTTALSSVSCASGALCVAVDKDGDALVSSAPASGASEWHKRTLDLGTALDAVACFAPGSCVTVDSAGDALASSNPGAAVGSAGAGSGATWSSTAFDPFGSPTAVSCSASGLCVATDATGHAFASDDPTTAPPAWPGIAQSPDGLTGVACVAEGLCVASTETGGVSTTVVPAPSATTTAVLEVSHTTALLTGTVNPQDAALSDCHFEYGTTTSYGSSAQCSSLPNGSTPQPVSAVVANLTANTTYYYRLVASTAIGTSEGTAETFKTVAPYVVEPHPSIGGTPAPGERLTCKSGVASSSGATLAYAWLRDTATIAGASGSTYLVSSADISHHLQCRVTATTTEGSRSATSVFVTVPAGGLGTISETTVGTPRAGRDAVSVTVKCTPQAVGNCTLKLRLTVLETLNGSRVVAVAARTRRATVTVGASTVRLKPGQQATAVVALNATGRRLLSHLRRMPVRLAVSGTVIGAISASLRSATVTLSAPARVPSRRASHGRTAASAGAARHPRSAREASGAATSSAALAPTPYMGWDTYFTFGGRYEEASILEQASELETRGLEREGYRYIWLDVGWWQGTRNAAGEITVNPTQWPHGMRWLTSTLHAAGFKVGLYTDAGSEGCGGPSQGSYGRYQQDVNTFAAWGFDAIKVDFCGGVREGLQPAAAYAAFHEAIVHNSSHRPLLLSICDYLQPGQFASEDPSLENSAFDSYTFGPSSGNSWRTDTDIGVPGVVEFNTVLRNLDADAAEPQAAGPGHWNDPDYLGPDQGMTAAQFRTQFSMWAMLAAPLMVSANMISLSSASDTTLSDREAIAIDQDPAGLQARLLAASGNGQVWVKPLADGERALALLNRGSSTLSISTSASAIGMGAASGYLLHNVWTGAVSRIGSGASITASVPGDSTVLLRVAAD